MSDRPRRATCATTRSSPAPTGRTRSPTARIRVLVLFYFYELGYTPFEVAIAVPLLRGLRHRHEPRRRLPRRALRAEGARWSAGWAPRSSRCRCSRSRPQTWLGRAVRDGRAGAVGHRQGPHQDELQERGEARRARDASDALFRWVAILTGSKNALKGVGFFVGGLLLTVIGFQTRADRARGVLVGGALVGRCVADARRPRTSRAQGEVQRTCSRTRARSTCSPPRGSSCSARATSGSWSACPCSCGPSSAGASGRSARSSPLGDRLRHRAGIRAARCCAAAGTASRRRRPAQPRSGVRPRRVPGGDRDRRLRVRRRPDASSSSSA